MTYSFLIKERFTEGNHSNASNLKSSDVVSREVIDVEFLAVLKSKCYTVVRTILVNFQALFFIASITALIESGFFKIGTCLSNP